jgi:hypothetical protein
MYVSLVVAYLKDHHLECWVSYFLPIHCCVCIYRFLNPVSSSSCSQACWPVVAETWDLKIRKPVTSSGFGCIASCNRSPPKKDCRNRIGGRGLEVKNILFLTFCFSHFYWHSTHFHFLPFISLLLQFSIFVLSQ